MTSCVSGMSRSSFQRERHSSMTSPHSLLRWETESSEIPVPLKSFRASAVLSMAACGSRQGPALNTCNLPITFYFKWSIKVSIFLNLSNRVSSRESLANASSEHSVENDCLRWGMSMSLRTFITAGRLP